MKTLILVAAFALAGCASTSGVVPAGDGVYSILSTDNSPSATIGDLRMTAYKQASAYCESKGKTMRLIGDIDIPGSGTSRRTSVQFMCLG